MRCENKRSVRNRSNEENIKKFFPPLSYGFGGASFFMALQIGDKVGRLTILDIDKRIVNGKWRIFCYCQCECGNKKWIRRDSISLDKRKTQSCGCYGREYSSIRNATHRQSNTPTYKVWFSMKQRCLNPADPNHKVYRDRGITICDRWRDSFENFLADMGERPSKGHTLDRIDVNGNYEPSNCRWATMKEQQNNKRNNVRLTLNGETHTLSEWADILGMPYTTLASRHKRGKNVEEILSPIKKNYIN